MSEGSGMLGTVPTEWRAESCRPCASNQGVSVLAVLHASGPNKESGRPVGYSPGIATSNLSAPSNWRVQTRITLVLYIGIPRLEPRQTPPAPDSVSTLPALLVASCW